MTKGFLCPHCKGDLSPHRIRGDLGIPLKEWRKTEAEKHGISAQAIYHRLTRQPSKYYPNLQITKINQRVVFVREG